MGYFLVTILYLYANYDKYEKTTKAT